MSKVETFVVLDLDRTLLDSPKLVSSIAPLFGEAGVPILQQAALYAHIRTQDGNQFDYVSYLRKELGDTIVNRVVDMVRTKLETGELYASELFFDGVQELFEVLDGRGVPHAIFTAGGDETQQLKLELLEAAFGKHVPAKIVDHARKAHVIQSEWFDTTEQMYTIPTELCREGSVQAKRIVLLDDKPENLEYDGEGIETFLIDNANTTSDAISIATFVERLTADPMLLGVNG